MSSSDIVGDTTYSFSTEGREEYVEVMQSYGYVEFKGYIGDEPAGLADDDLPRSYSCGNCASMVGPVTGSPTGYWCKKFGFPDRPNGCCSGWSPKT